MTSTASTSLASMTFTASFNPKTLLIVMVGSSLAPKWPILVPFCGMDHQKSNFSLILALFLSEAIEASRCYFFENWWMKLKCPLVMKPLATIVQENSQSFYPSEPFRISHFTMRHPVGLEKNRDSNERVLKPLNFIFILFLFPDLPIEGVFKKNLLKSARAQAWGSSK